MQNLFVLLQGIVQGADESYLPQSRTLPFCAEHESCTCCNAHQAGSILRSIISGLRDPLLSDSCRDWTTRMACRPCDADVGTGLKPRVCQQTCNDWFQSCKDDYVEETQLSGQIRPCSEEASVCSRVSEVAADGVGLCKAYGLQVALDNSYCFDGQPTHQTYTSCQQGTQKGSSIRSRQQLTQMAWLGIAGAVLLILATFGWRQLKSMRSTRHQPVSHQASPGKPNSSSSVIADASRRRAVNLRHSRLAE